MIKHQPTASSVDPLRRRAIEIAVVEEFHSVLRALLGEDAADHILDEVVAGLAASAAAEIQTRNPVSTLADLWRVWGELGAEGRLDLHLEELSDSGLRFHVDGCAYADLYRSRGQEALGIAFSCKRDEPFARALIPAVAVEQSTTILEGGPRCEFIYTLETR